MPEQDGLLEPWWLKERRRFNSGKGQETLRYGSHAHLLVNLKTEERPGVQRWPEAMRCIGVSWKDRGGAGPVVECEFRSRSKPVNLERVGFFVSESLV